MGVCAGMGHATLDPRRLAMKPALTFLFIFSLVSCPNLSDQAHALVSREEKVTFYPTYGYKEGENWVIPMRVWVRERRALSEHLSNEVAESMGDLGLGEIKNFQSRTQDFVADSESREEVTFVFDNDPANQRYSVRNSRGDSLKTDQNGLIEGVIKLSITEASELLSRQGSRDGWLTYRATSSGHSGTGRVRLLGPSGLSVISDIDDTIKVTEIPAGSKIVVRNTFFRDFVAASEMAAMYQGLQGASFHYVSGGPWQLYEPLSQFLLSERTGFPEGTFHMKNVRKNLLSMNSWEDLKTLVTNENATMEQKLSQIGEILRRFPERRFILIGDSGEKDPEVYRKIRDRFRDQVLEIRIRDVVNDREKNPGRLQGMTIIPTPAVVRGVSQFGN
jgi:phosphatidate phosphatase APP1